MNLREYSRDLVVFLFLEDVDRGASIKIPVATAGYQTYFFSDMKTLQDRMKQMVPQVIVFETTSMKQSLSDFVQYCLNLDAEIRFIPIAGEHQFPILAQYNQYGFEDIISFSDVALPERVLWSLDRLTERMLFALQNKKLIEDLQFYKTSAIQNSKNEITEKSKPIVQLVYPIAERIQTLRAASTPEDLIQRYLNFFTQLKVVYFKALPTVASFVALSGVQVDSSQVNGVGISLAPADRSQFLGQLKLHKASPEFAELLKKHFQIKVPRLQALYVGEELHGLFAFSEIGNTADEHEYFDGFKLFSLVYENMFLSSRVGQLQLSDSLTGLFLKSYYDKKLTEEFDRAQRARLPVSVLKVCLDDFFEIEQSLGEPVRDQVLQLIAKEMSSTGRKHDIAARTGQNEFSLLLPHCERGGAMIRAERLRRSIEASTAVSGGIRLSVSIGLSEYPSLCSSALDLDRTALLALQHIAGKGGNRLCAWKADPSHQPEFVVAAAGVSKT